MNHDFVIVHKNLGWYWAGRLRWTSDLSEAKVYRTRKAVEGVCTRLNRQYKTLTAQYMTLEDLEEAN